MQQHPHEAKTNEQLLWKPTYHHATTPTWGQDKQTTTLETHPTSRSNTRMRPRQTNSCSGNPPNIMHQHPHEAKTNEQLLWKPTQYQEATPAWGQDKRTTAMETHPTSCNNTRMRPRQANNCCRNPPNIKQHPGWFYWMFTGTFCSVFYTIQRHKNYW